MVDTELDPGPSPNIKAAPRLKQSLVNYASNRAEIGRGCQFCAHFIQEGHCRVLEERPLQITASGGCDVWMGDVRSQYHRLPFHSMEMLARFAKWAQGGQLFQQVRITAVFPDVGLVQLETTIPGTKEVRKQSMPLASLAAFASDLLGVTFALMSPEDLDAYQLEPDAPEMPEGPEEGQGLYTECDVVHFLAKPVRWPQGKGRVVSKLTPLIPEHELYVEPFCGGATLFWAKPPSMREVLADLNPDATDLLRFLQRASDRDFTTLRRRDWSCDTAERFSKVFNSKPKTLLDRFFRTVFVNRWGHWGRGGAFAPSHKGRNSERPVMLDKLEKYRDRLRGVTILTQDAMQTVEQFDSPATFFYLDPPYAVEGTRTQLGEMGHYDMRASVPKVMQLKGKVLLSHSEDKLLPWKKQELLSQNPNSGAEARVEFAYRNY